MQLDDSRISKVEVQLATMASEMTVVQEGVANFREFQLANREFMGWFKQREKEREEKDQARARFHYWLLGILSALIVAGIIGTATYTVKFLNSHHISENSVTKSQPSTQDARN